MIYLCNVKDFFMFFLPLPKASWAESYTYKQNEWIEISEAYVVM